MPKRRAELGIAEAALLFAALGDETRLGVLRMLSEAGPASISTLAASFEVSRQAVSKHLQLLASADVIRGERQGREHVWALNPDRLAEARRCIERIAAGWDDALLRLKSHLEDT